MSSVQIWGLETGWSEVSPSMTIWHRGKCSPAGTVSVRFSFKNNTSKTIKYLRIYVTPYNAVGDVPPSVLNVQSSSIVDNGTACLVYTGPIKPGKIVKDIETGNVWHHLTIVRCKLERAEIEYMDGGKETLDANEIDTTSAGGCYVATAVYGSYDCPQVWTLRRYRDNILAKTRHGRLFIRVYYAVSPILVKWFGQSKWFQRLCRPQLDRLVYSLNSNGVKNTPYEDIEI